MKKLLAFSFLLATSMMVNGQQFDNCIKDPFIQVSGTAKMEIVPDQIFLDIMLSEENRTDKKQLQQLEYEFISIIDELDIPRDNLSLTDANSAFIKVPFWGKKISKSKEYQLMVKDVSTISKLFEKLDEVGISNISIAYVDHSQMTQFKKEVKINAVKAAKEKAIYLLEAIGKEIGDPISIIETDHIVPSLRANVAGVSTRGAGSSSSVVYIDNQLVFEKITLSYAILASFKIKE